MLSIGSLSVMSPIARLPQRRRIALLIETSRAYGRSVMRSIAEYARHHGQWSFYFEQRQTGESPPDWLESWDGDGIISRVDDDALASAIRRTGLPAVDLRGITRLGLPVVKADDAAISALVFEHFAERGFPRVAFCGYAGVPYSERRLEHFVRQARHAGLSCWSYQSDPQKPAMRQREIECLGVLHEPALDDWLRSLPKPVGLMACNDVRGQQILNSCRAIGIDVSEQIAVVGVDNDEMLCELSNPPLSSVQLDTRQTGFAAARLLSRMMDGEHPPARPILIPPQGIMIRQSSDVLAADDADVAAALRCIRNGATNGIEVADIAKFVGIGRRTLERRFSKCLGKTINELIVKTRLDQAKMLLTDTDWPIKKVADRSGFCFSQYFSVVFKRETGMAPRAYRQRHRAKPNAP